ncbi:MAG: PQQ-binding-like beta-propeller repeat protein [Verrucomicrobia bacterium]|nr:PQQ-binding-like beta-propeller repeat protein [Verrucomicrobiota bacterium]
MRTLLSTLLGLTVASFTLHADNWPCFRGPTRQGQSSETGLPLHWSATSNVLWRTAIPGEAWSSPIVWGDRVFVTTATDNGFSLCLLCLDRKSGQVVWNREVFQQKPSRKEGKNSYATPTPICDGQHVYVVFGDGSFAALTLDGVVAWSNREVKFYSRHGLGASPILHGDLLIMPIDWSTPVDAPGIYPKVSDEERTGWQLPWDKSFVRALDKRTGKEVWRGPRGMSRIAHVTPNVWTGADGRAEIISGAGDVIQGFDPKTGERLWTVRSRGEGVVPSMVLGEGLAFTVSGFEATTIRAVRPGGKGDVTASQLVWEQKKGAPTLASLVYAKPHLFAVTDGGIVTCLKAASGDIVWQERLGSSGFSASPVVADGRLYILSENAETFVVPADGEFKVLARNPLGEKCQASMAVSQKQLFIRTAKSLFCIAE